MAEILQHVKALTFDVFGTVVDWRSSVRTALADAFRQKAASSEFNTLAADLQQRARTLAAAPDDLAKFAQEWRDTYVKFTRTFVPGKTPWKDVDAHHHDSLVEQLERWQLAGLFSEQEIRELSLVWHRLAPWADSAEGVQRLGKRFVTATLSNGNTSLLSDLNEYGKLGFQKIISGEDFRAYKPDPSVYLGAAEKIGVKPTEVAMVAAHLMDLDAARKQGLRTVYVERPDEEWEKGDPKYVANAKSWVDIWVSQDEDGFREVAKRLGL